MRAAVAVRFEDFHGRTLGVKADDHDRGSHRMFEVIYYSLTGNTRKLAQAIAAELGVSADDVKAKDGLAAGSLVFPGAGLYGPLRGWGLKQFIDRNDFQGSPRIRGGHP